MIKPFFVYSVSGCDRSADLVKLRHVFKKNKLRPFCFSFRNDCARISPCVRWIEKLWNNYSCFLLWTVARLAMLLKLSLCQWGNRKKLSVWTLRFFLFVCCCCFLTPIWPKQNKTPGCINMWACFVRKNACYEPLQVPEIRQNTYQWGNRVWYNTCAFHWVNVSPFNVVSPRFLSHSLSTFAGIFLFWGVELLQLFKLFHHYLVIGTR